MSPPFLVEPQPEKVGVLFFIGAARLLRQFGLSPSGRPLASGRRLSLEILIMNLMGIFCFYPRTKVPIPEAHRASSSIYHMARLLRQFGPAVSLGLPPLASLSWPSAWGLGKTLLVMTVFFGGIGSNPELVSGSVPAGCRFNENISCRPGLRRR